LFSAVVVGGLGIVNIGKGGLSTLVPPCRRHFRYALRTGEKVEWRRQWRLTMGHDEGQHRDLMMSGWWWWWQILLSPDCKSRTACCCLRELLDLEGCKGRLRDGRERSKISLGLSIDYWDWEGIRKKVAWIALCGNKKGG